MAGYQELITSLTTLTVPSCRSRLFAVSVDGLPLNDLLIGVDDPGEVIAGLQDVTWRVKSYRLHTVKWSQCEDRKKENTKQANLNWCHCPLSQWPFWKQHAAACHTAHTVPERENKRGTEYSWCYWYFTSYSVRLLTQTYKVTLHDQIKTLDANSIPETIQFCKKHGLVLIFSDEYET